MTQREMKSHTFIMQMTPSMREQIEKRAEKEDVSAAEIVRKAIKESLRKKRAR